MFERKLSALQYDRPSVDPESETEFRNLVYWLESMKIRSYPPEDRNCLSVDSKHWNESFQKYLSDINYQGSRDDHKLILDWLLNLALRYEMEDTRNQIRMSKNEISDLANVTSTDDFSNLNSPEFIAELKDLASLLNVPFYEDEPLITLRAIAILLCKLRKSSLDEQQTNTEQQQQKPNKKQKVISQVDENILNMKFGSQKSSNQSEPIMNRCMNVLRLLYIKDLRDLQTNVNNAIVQLQSITANPKTDSSLGKVGK